MVQVGHGWTEERQHEQEDFLSADSWIPVQPVQQISFLFVNH